LGTRFVFMIRHISADQDELVMYDVFSGSTERRDGGKYWFEGKYLYWDDATIDIDTMEDDPLGPLPSIEERGGDEEETADE
ncbi:MAG: hypothetical protein Q4A79_02985, partial [Candidatus Saccharibacteria bacterium]|nr:hypothetical protein [Candidatus Saccharibacteria bacterium]